jgi:hypothetical protein
MHMLEFFALQRMIGCDVREEIEQAARKTTMASGEL